MSEREEGKKLKVGITGNLETGSLGSSSSGLFYLIEGSGL